MPSWTIFPKHCSTWYICMWCKYNAMLTHCIKTAAGPDLPIFLVLWPVRLETRYRNSHVNETPLLIFDAIEFLLHFCKIEQVKDGTSNLIIILLILVNLFFYLNKKVANEKKASLYSCISCVSGLHLYSSYDRPVMGNINIHAFMMSEWKANSY